MFAIRDAMPSKNININLGNCQSFQIYRIHFTMTNQQSQNTKKGHKYRMNVSYSLLTMQLVTAVITSAAAINCSCLASSSTGEMYAKSFDFIFSDTS